MKKVEEVGEGRESWRKLEKARERQRKFEEVRESLRRFRESWRKLEKVLCGKRDALLMHLSPASRWAAPGQLAVICWCVCHFLLLSYYHVLPLAFPTFYYVVTTFYYALICFFVQFQYFLLRFTTFLLESTSIHCFVLFPGVPGGPPGVPQGQFPEGSESF